MRMFDHPVIYVGTTASVLDEIAATLEPEMVGHGQIFISVEKIANGTKEFPWSQSTWKVLNEISEYATETCLGGDVILYKE